MDKKQEKHLQDIKTAFDRWVDCKYRRGAKSHGGNLMNMAPDRVLDEAIDECVDMFTYLLTLRSKI